MADERTHWLLVERFENWVVDHREGFAQFGIPDSRLKLAEQIKKGDLLIFYVSSSISKFADIREATKNGVSKLSLGGRYDTAFPWRVETKPFLILERPNWVAIKDVLLSLSITRGKKDWRQVMRQSLRRLPAEDGEFIVAAMQMSHKATPK